MSCGFNLSYKRPVPTAATACEPFRASMTETQALRIHFDKRLLDPSVGTLTLLML